MKNERGAFPEGKGTRRKVRGRKTMEFEKLQQIIAEVLNTEPDEITNEHDVC